jgi:isopenicillin N synthase-like dioxygenase
MGTPDSPRNTHDKYLADRKDNVVSATFPLINLASWYGGSPQARGELAEQMDRALRTSGFLLLAGHGVPGELRDEVRTVAREFFALPAEVKAKYDITIGGRGWIASKGADASGYEGVEQAPDLKESYSVGADRPIGDSTVDMRWYRPNVWPEEVPRMQQVITSYLGHMHRLADEVMSMGALALGLSEDFFIPFQDHPTYGFNVNRYPSADSARPSHPGQFNVAPHTDFGTITLLDRQALPAQLQIFVDDDWMTAPYVPDTLTVNIGDLMARWTGDRWRSTRHRVLPSRTGPTGADGLSLVFFYEANHDAVIESMPEPIGTRAYPPVVSRQYLRERLATIAPRHGRVQRAPVPNG